MESIICRQVTEYLESNGLLKPTIHGYHGNHSCATAIIEAYEEAFRAQEEGGFCCLNLYDQSSAFDLVDHRIFASKLRILRFDDNAVRYFKSFLEGRKQLVEIDGCRSSTNDIECGAPQGSTSGHLVWLLYTLELAEVLSADEEETEANAGKEIEDNVEYESI